MNSTSGPLSCVQEKEESNHTNAIKERPLEITFPPTSFKGTASSILVRVQEGQAQDVPAARAIIDTIAKPVTPQRCILPPMRTYTWAPSFYYKPVNYVTPSNFKHLLKTWSAYSSQDGREKGIPLAGSENFSGAFCNALGSMNTIYIYGLEDSKISERIFQHLVENEAIRQFYAGNQTLYDLCELDEQDISVHFDAQNNNTLRWKIHGMEGCGTFVKFFQKFFDLSRLDAIATLADIVRMSYSTLFELSKTTHTYNLELMMTVHCDLLPEAIRIGTQPELTFATCTGYVLFKSYSGGVIGAAVLYKYEQTHFYLPAAAHEGALSIGQFTLTAYFLNQELMEQHPDAPVILCQDMRLAVAICIRLKQIIVENTKKFIITGHLGSNLDVLPWSSLHRRDVIFVPAPTKQGLAMAKRYQDCCLEHVSTFNVYPGFILHSKPTEDLTAPIAGASRIEQVLWRNTIYVEDEKQPLELLQRIERDALPYTDFKEWGRKLGVFKKRESAGALSAATQANPFMPESLVLSATGEPSRIENELDTLITPENTTLLWGPSNVGKSYAALEIARVLIFGGTAFGLRSAGGKKVCYLDGEQDSTRTGKRLRQLSGGGDLLWQQKVQESFSYKALDSGATRTPEAAAMLAQTAAECGADVLVIDNIISLFPSAKNNPSKVLEFVHTVEKKGMAVIFVHHSEKTGQTFLGASELGALSKNIFKLMPVEPTGDDPSEITQARLEKGPLACITLEKTKVLPCAEGNSVVAHLPISGQWRVLQGGFVEDVPEAQPEPQTTACSNEGNASAPQIGNLSPDERRVYEYLQRDSASRANIETAVGFKEDKVRGILKKLMKLGLVEKHDNGKNTYYAIITHA